MRSYSIIIPEVEEHAFAFARLEGVDASYKDLAQVCGRIRNKKPENAIVLLEMAAEGEIPIMYKKHNRYMGHRHELGGAKGRYPVKAAKIVLGVLKSAIANAKVKNLTGNLVIVHATANKKSVFPRLAPKGRRSRSYLETARIEIVLKGKASHVKKIEADKNAPQISEAEVEKKIEKEVKKTITSTEEERKVEIDEKKTENEHAHHHEGKKIIKPRQQKDKQG